MDYSFKKINVNILSVLDKGDILFIVPPFVTPRIPILGPHILQSIAVEHGYKADILYLNLLLASIIGTDLYESICYGQPFRMLGERLFARIAYGLPPLGKKPELCLNPAKSVFGNRQHCPIDKFEYKFLKTIDFDPDTFPEIEEICKSFIEEVTQTITSLNYKIVGCSTNWEQNNCSIALINRLKTRQPNIITLMGGSNCEDEMAEGIASLSDSIDYIFSGESESTFSDFLKNYSTGDLPSQRVIAGEPIENLDKIPLPDYGSYFQQIDCFFTDEPLTGVVISLETSRGCWWGKCTFCGMNGKHSNFRQKGVTKVVEELERVNAQYPGYKISIIDKVMPTSYRKELLPLLSKKKNISDIIYEQRSNLELVDLINLKKANIIVIKPGIEAFSTDLLNLMNKGVTANQNILLLRNSKSVGMLVSWNILWGFPGDKASFYEKTLKLLPLLRHLQPPAVFRHISLDRFSEYFKRPADYQIDALRPWEVYNMIYPQWADVDKLAYRFIGDYPCEAHENTELIREIAKEIELWEKKWRTANLIMTPFSGYYIISDSRCDGKDKYHTLNTSQAKEVMKPCAYNGSEYQKWAVEKQLGVVLDSRYVPLTTAQPELLLQFEEEACHN